MDGLWEDNLPSTYGSSEQPYFRTDYPTPPEAERAPNTPNPELGPPPPY